MTILYGDLETFSEVELTKCGTHAYAEASEIMLFPYAIDDGEPQCWDVTSGVTIPDDLRNALADPSVQTVWHNGGMFDLVILEHVGAKYNIPSFPHSRVFDTMVCAFAHSLPGSLGVLGDVLGVSDDKAKHKTGKALIRLFCKPRPKTSKVRRATKETNPEEWAQFVEYAKADISSMREVYKKLPKWNYTGAEYDLWLLDQKINNRGITVDADLARGAVASAEKAKVVLAAQSNAMTDGEVASTTKRDVLLAYIFEEYGIPLPDLQKDTLERRLNDPDVPEPLKELLRVRLQASTTSISKYHTLLRAVSKDGRLRGLLQFDGAGRTGRWSGRLFQPQNLMRPNMKQTDIDFAIEVIKADACELFYDDIMRVISNAVRGSLVSAEGKKFYISDLSNIEGRVAAWLAGEEWKVKYFFDYDAGLIPFDNYVVAYAKAFGVSPEVVAENKKNGDGSMRQIGKVCLAGDTLVLTDNGVKSIVGVSLNDRLWDGAEWVQHAGLLTNGVRKVVNVAGIELTPDHLMLTGRTWTQAQELVSNESMLSLALATGSENLPPCGCFAKKKALAKLTWWKFNVPAVQRRMWCSLTTYAKAKARDAGSVLPRLRGIGGKNITGTRILCQTTPTAYACSDASPHASTAVGTQKTRGITTTAGEALPSTRHGSWIEKSFFATLYQSRVGMCLLWSSIASTLRRATNPATFALSRTNRTKAREEKFGRCRNASNAWKPVYDIANAGPLNRFTVISDRGPIIVHNCELMLQYEGGVGAFVTGAATYGIDLDEMSEGALPNIDEDVLEDAKGFLKWTVKKKRATFGLADDAFVACDALKRLWRGSHPMISSYWGELKDAFINAVEHPGNTYTARMLKFRKRGAWLTIELPSGRFLCYPSPRVDDGVCSYMGMNQYTRKWQRLKTYGGKLFENCIAEGTPVMTTRGWVPIHEVKETDKVWDGVAFVPHKGAVYKGKQFTVSAFGVRMTPDHKVLTTGGWISASSCERHNRFDCRLPDSQEVPRIGRDKIYLGSGLRVRENDSACSNRTGEAIEKRGSVLLRVYAPCDDRQAQHTPRHVSAPRLRSVAVHDRSLFFVLTSGVGELRRAGHRSLRRLAERLRSLLEGHGPYIPERIHPRQTRQRQRILPRELCLENLPRAGQQHEENPLFTNTEREDVCVGGSSVLRGGSQHLGLPSGALLAPEKSVRAVYDLIDCGPRHRFVVQGVDGLPLIVHNCCQAVARDVMAYSMPRAEQAGYEILLTVHDELITEAPDTGAFSVDELSGILSSGHDWSKGLPLAAAGFESYRYRKD